MMLSAMGTGWVAARAGGGVVWEEGRQSGGWSSRPFSWVAVERRGTKETGSWPLRTPYSTRPEWTMRKLGAVGQLFQRYDDFY
jgi:hypothetical protein